MKAPQAEADQTRLTRLAAAAIRRLTANKAISQRRLELLLGLSQGYLSRLAAGDGAPSAHLALLLALLANFSPDSLDAVRQVWETSMSEEQTKARRGFSAMPKETHKRIASQGGKAAHATGLAHRFTPEEARAQGRKGGKVAASKPERMQTISKLSGAARRSRPQVAIVNAGTAEEQVDRGLFLAELETLRESHNLDQIGATFGLSPQIFRRLRAGGLSPAWPVVALARMLARLPEAAAALEELRQERANLLARLAAVPPSITADKQ